MRATLRYVVGGTDGIQLDVEDGATIGRGRDNDLVVDDASVSRRHAVVQREGAAWVLSDLGSANGTFVNDHRLLVPQRLSNGDLVRLGRAEIRFESDAPDGGADLRPAPDDATITGVMPPAAPGDDGVTVVGVSPAMRSVFDLVRKAATSTIPVLVGGETGTGKELVAHAIHAESARRAKPFIPVNCAALPETLLESQLFGHRKGSFTGATQDQSGVFEAADGGTIFLDEIGEMPVTMQPKLLRVLQEGEVVRVGDTLPRSVDVRVISATNRLLEESIAAGEFREDLYYRLAAFPIRLPPLRDRREDIPLLAERFIAAAMRRHDKQVVGLHPETIALLVAFDWPGNVRQLQNEVQRAVVLVDDGDRVRPEHLSIGGSGTGAVPAADEAPVPGAADGGSLADARAEFERRHIVKVLEQEGGNVSRAATVLGVSRVGLHRKLKEYGIR